MNILQSNRITNAALRYDDFIIHCNGVTEVNWTELKSHISYDADTGVMNRLKASGRHGCHKAGSPMGWKRSDGYVGVGVMGRQMLMHRLVWFYVHGEWPKHDIDHIDGDRSNNRISNLRAATRSENFQNLKKAKSNSASGSLGVHRRNGASTWVAQITSEGKTYCLGSYKTKAEAEAAYRGAKIVLHPFGVIE